MTSPYRLDRDIQFRNLSPEQREQLMLQVAKGYFLLDMTMSDMAKELGLTRWQASRLLTEARETGLVKIEIVPHSPRMPHLEAELQRRFDVREAVIAGRLPNDDGIFVLESVARAACQFLSGLGRLPAIGVSWGRTMTAVARQLPPGWSEGIEVILLNGAANFKSTSSQTNNVAELFARAGRGVATNLPVPAIVAQSETREALVRDSTIAGILAEASRVPVACFGIGALAEDSVLKQSGFLTSDDIASLRSKGAVGDVLGRFIDRDGNIVDVDLNNRTIGVSLDSCKSRELSIGVAAGYQKLDVIAGCLKARYINVLVTDEATARLLLETTDNE